MPDLLDQTRNQIAARLKELKPLLDEYTRLQAAADALDATVITSTAPAAPAKRPRATKLRPASSSSTGRRGRPKGSGTRGAEALALVKAQPGITIPELAARMAIKQNYLYRVLPGLAQDGLVEKQGRGWHAKDAA